MVTITELRGLSWRDYCLVARFGINEFGGKVWVSYFIHTKVVIDRRSLCILCGVYCFFDNSLIFKEFIFI